MNIHVSNLGFGVQSEDLKKIFTPYGVISSVNIIMDKITNRSRGFAFVQMTNKNEAERAMTELNGAMLDGRSIKLNEARGRTDGPSKGMFY
jgi:RNA recognition motif-containing protein